MAQEPASSDVSDWIYLFSQRLRHLRNAADLTQEELGQQSGMSRVTIGRLEHGVRPPDLDQALRLANGLGLRSVEELLGELPGVDLSEDPPLLGPFPSQTIFGE